MKKWGKIMTKIVANYVITIWLSNFDQLQCHRSSQFSKKQPTREVKYHNLVQLWYKCIHFNYEQRRNIVFFTG